MYDPEIKFAVIKKKINKKENLFLTGNDLGIARPIYLLLFGAKSVKKEKNNEVRNKIFNIVLPICALFFSTSNAHLKNSSALNK